MKIAVFSASASPHMRAYADALVGAGHQITLITTHPDNHDLPFPVVRLHQPGPIERRLPTRLRTWLVGQRLRRALRSEAFDVLNVQQMTSVGVLAATVFDGPTVLTFWGSDLLLPDLQPAWARALMPAAVRRASVVHVCSEQMRAAALDIGAAPERVVSFQYGIDLGRFTFGGAHRDPHLVVSNRLLRPLYRIDVLVRALALVIREVADARLVIFGRGGEHGALVKLAAELGIGSSVSFAGFAPAEELAGALACAAVWASLPPSDGAPLSLMEAMAGGAVPVVADIPTLHEWIGPGRGVFVGDVTPEGVAAGILDGFRIAEDGAYAVTNRTLIQERGDRTKNLPRFVRIIEASAHGRPLDPADR